MSKQRFLCTFLGGVAVFLLLAVVPAGNHLLAAERSPAEKAEYGIFPLKHISAEQARKHLSEVVSGTISQLGGTQALLVTAKPADLVRAKAVLSLVDANEPFVVKVILKASEATDIPTNKQIAESLGNNISVGTFSSPPEPNAGTRVIIDRYNGSAVAVVPAALLEKVVSAMSQLREAAKKAKASDVVPEAADSEAETLDIMADMEDIAGEAEDADPNRAPKQANASKIERRQPADGNEPNAPAAVPDNRGPEREKPGRKRSGTKPPAQKTQGEQITELPEPNGTSAGPAYSPVPLANGEEIIKVELPKTLDIITLLGLVGQYYNLDFMYDPVKVKGDLTLQVHGQYRGPIKVKDLYPLLERVLKFKGFVMTRGKGNLVTIAPLAEAMDVDPALIEPEKTRVETGDVVVTRAFHLQYVDTASAMNLLTSMKLGQNVSPIVETGTLIVTEYAYRMQRVETLLDMIDKPGKPKKFRFRQLKYTMSKTLAPKVKSLAEQLGSISVTIAEPTVPTIPGQPPRITPPRPQTTPVRPIIPGRTGTQAPGTAEGGVYLDADERTNRVLMIGLEEQLDTVEKLIDALDVEQQDLRTMKLYKIEHVDAEEVRKKLQELGIVGAAAPVTSGRSSRITTGAAPQQTAQQPPQQPVVRPPTTTAGEETEALVEEPQVIIIEATNSLLVNATAEQHAQITTILSYVDSSSEERNIPYVIYPLENQKPTDLAGVLEKLIQETVKDKEGKIEKVVKKIEDEIVIVPDENTFSLIVYASKKNQEWIKNLIETLDKRRPQVLIDVTLVEVSKNDKFEYDLNLIESFPDLTATSGLTGSIVEGKSSSNIISQLSTSGRDRFIDFQSDPKSNTGVGFYGDKHINLLLNAMQTKDYGRVLAKPKILVNDNEQGSISTTDTTYVTKTSSIPVSGGGAGTNTTLIQTQVDYQGYDAGIKLEITPHISEGQLLRLEITLTRSDFGTITGSKPPDTTASDIKTIVTVPDGSTIILGGMLKLNQGRGGSKVPLLGDMPVVGVLFRSVSNSDLQRRLYIFVKAEIIRPAETLAQGLPDLERISERNRMAFEKFEQEFQRHDTIPALKPKPTEPAKVIDAE